MNTILNQYETLVRSEVNKRRPKLLPKLFDHGLIRDNLTYFAALGVNDFSIIRTGKVFNEKYAYSLDRSIAYTFIPGFELIYHNVDEVYEKFLGVLSKPSVFVCILKDSDVRYLKSFSKQLCAQDKVYRDLSKVKNLNSRIVFRAHEGNNSIMEFDIAPNPSGINIGGFSKANKILPNTRLDLTFVLECKYMKYLPNGELEVRYSDQGLLSFYSTKKQESVHFSTKHFTVK